MGRRVPAGRPYPRPLAVAAFLIAAMAAQQAGAQSQGSQGSDDAPDQAAPDPGGSDGADFGRAAEGEFLLLGGGPGAPAAFDQAGPDLTPEEERALISGGWQNDAGRDG